MRSILGLEADPRGDSSSPYPTGKPWGSRVAGTPELTWLYLPFYMCRAEYLGQGAWRFQFNFVLLSSQTWPRTIRSSES